MIPDIKQFFKEAQKDTNGILHLAPTWVPYTFSIPGRRLKLHPNDIFSYGLGRGGIDERWLSSTCKADCGPGTREDDGLSYVINGSKRILLKSIIEECGAEVLGDKVMNKWGGLKVFAKFFDNLDPLPFHIHSQNIHAKEINMEGKAEAYYFPPQVNQTFGLFPFTFFGLEPGVTKKQVRKCIEDFEKGDNKILELSKAYKLEVGTGWLLPPGILHAPGTLCTFEVQWASDIYSMYQSVVFEKPLDKSLLIKDIPEDKRVNYIDYLIEMLDWEANLVPNFKDKFFIEPIDIGNTLSEGYQEKWIVYGNVDHSELFSAKELVLLSGKKITSTENGAYGIVVIQGHGSINGINVESPTMIRFGEMTQDEFFIPYPIATEGVLIKNTGFEPLVILKIFGPDCNPNMPHKK